MSREYPDHPRVGLGVVVLRPGAVLLVRRAKPPAQGSWSIPGGAQELGETAEDGARRELAEETGLTVGRLLLVANVDSIHPGENGRPRFHYTILDFAAAWEGGEPVANSDVSACRFFGFDELPAMGLWSETLRVVTAARTALAL